MERLLLVVIALLPTLTITPKLPSYWLLELVLASNGIASLEPRRTSTPTTDVYAYESLKFLADRITVSFFKTNPKEQWWITLEGSKISVEKALGIVNEKTDLDAKNSTDEFNAFVVKTGLFMGSCLTVHKKASTMNIYSFKYLEQNPNPCQAK
ncbi:MAG: hypothetical protein HC933_11535 [Pleurocapsa sp. SU_196_0]|nr:hypothetical protein [Pleurocapsa sp. SU_196_0]